MVYIINCILFKTKRFERELGSLAKKEFEDFPFHYTYCYIITVLYKEGNSKAVDILEELGLDPSTITRMVNKLKEQGVVKRGTVKSKKEIVLTPRNLGNDVIIKPPFMVDYGYNIKLGNNVFINYGTTILDCNEVIIGDNALIGPNVQIYPATHPTDPNIRREHLESAYKVEIGKDIWIGGGSIICAGVTIGNNVTIGAGSVVTKNIPDNTIALGNPCKPIKSLDKEVNSNQSIDFEGLGHINIIVDDIDEAIKFYKELFGVKISHMFREFKNIGFAKSAGFLDNPEDISVSMVFLEIPKTNLTLEIMQYHTPKTKRNKDMTIDVTQVNGVKHIALKVKNIDQAFEHVSSIKETKLINDSKDYKPCKIDLITEDEVMLPKENKKQKQNIVNTVDKIKYFYFIDKY